MTVRTLCLLFVCCLLCASAWAKTRNVATPPYKITGIQAKLFYSDKGTFSRNIIGKPEFALWNTIIGEGDAEGPSDATLVIVEVTGKTSESEAPPTRSVELTATSNGKVMVKKSIQIGLFSNDKYHAAFWLYDTGCSPVKITARITGQVQPSSITRTIPFQCGE